VQHDAARPQVLAGVVEHLQHPAVAAGDAVQVDDHHPVG
jgi:hypothetical protein